MSHAVIDWKPDVPAPPSRHSERTQGSFLPHLAVAYERGPSGQMERRLWLTVPASIEFEAPATHIARVVSLPGCVSQGSTKREAKENLASALADILKLHVRRGTRPQFSEPAAEFDLSTLVNLRVNVVEDT